MIFYKSVIIIPRKIRSSAKQTPYLYIYTPLQSEYKIWINLHLRRHNNLFLGGHQHCPFQPLIQYFSSCRILFNIVELLEIINSFSALKNQPRQLLTALSISTPDEIHQACFRSCCQRVWISKVCSGTCRWSSGGLVWKPLMTPVCRARLSLAKGSTAGPLLLNLPERVCRTRMPDASLFQEIKHRLQWRVCEGGCCCCRSGSCSASFCLLLFFTLYLLSSPLCLH